MYNTDCHGRGYYLYFTIAYANGTLACDPEGRPGLFDFGTDWYTTYPKVLRKAIFNDPTSHGVEEACKSGHCLSEVLPGVLYHNEPIRLKRVAHPELLRTGWNTMCQYDDRVRSIERKSVNLGSIGYFIHGASIPPVIIDYVEEKVRATYPTLEITLAVWLTVGLIPTLLALFVFICMMRRLAQRLVTVLPMFCASIARGHSVVWKTIIMAPGKLRNSLKGKVKRRKNSLNTPKNDQPTTSGYQMTHQLPTTHDQPPAYEPPTTYEQPTMYELPDWPLAPPSYCTYDSRSNFDVV